jgi:hypothetical protein
VTCNCELCEEQRAESLRVVWLMAEREAIVQAFAVLRALTRAA